MRAQLVAALSALACLLATAAAVSDKGVVYVDDLTFDKVVDGSRDTFVRFDKEYAWGDDHDAFKDAAKKIGESGQPLLVVSVPVSKREYDPQNVQLAERFGAEESAFPVYRLFKRGQDTAKPLAYPDGRSKKADDLMAWLAHNTGSFFGLKGQIKELDALARKLMAAAGEAERQAVADEGAKAAEAAGQAEDKQEAAKYYAKVMSKAVAQPGWPSSESKRLGGLVGGKMSDDKRTAMQLKLNVLASFLANDADRTAEL